MSGQDTGRGRTEELVKGMSQDELNFVGSCLWEVLQKIYPDKSVEELEDIIIKEMANG